MSKKFFTQENCDRCGKTLNVRTMSWFTDETICMDCSAKEDEIKKTLPDNGQSLEGCGYLPSIQKPEEKQC